MMKAWSLVLKFKGVLIKHSAVLWQKLTPAILRAKKLLNFTGLSKILSGKVTLATVKSKFKGAFATVLAYMGIDLALDALFDDNEKNVPVGQMQEFRVVLQQNMPGVKWSDDSGELYFQCQDALDSGDVSVTKAIISALRAVGFEFGVSEEAYGDFVEDAENSPIAKNLLAGTFDVPQTVLDEFTLQTRVGDGNPFTKGPADFESAMERIKLLKEACASMAVGPDEFAVIQLALSSVEPGDIERAKRVRV
jgi:hypothetical protein